MCLAQGQRSDAVEARTCGPSVSSQALYHCALPHTLYLKRESDTADAPLIDLVAFNTDLSIHLMHVKGERALRGYFGPPMRPKNENYFSQVSSFYFIRTIAQV